MQRLTTTPNLVLATLWRDMLDASGIDCHVQRAYTSSIAGEIPPDQCQPEIWIDDADQLDRARALLHAYQHPPMQRWVCRGCDEPIEGPFEQCWQCGADRDRPA
ncbi:MAG: DUF2007 domain-containing protein [Leptothrix sp. (in: b-proteobacteria)]